MRQWSSSALAADGRCMPKMLGHRKVPRIKRNSWTHVVFQHCECKWLRRGAPASTASGKAGHHAQRKLAWRMRLALATHTGRLTAAGLCSSCGLRFAAALWCGQDAGGENARPWASLYRAEEDAKGPGGGAVAARKVRGWVFCASFTDQGKE
jgi:hypothetical protein